MNLDTAFVVKNLLTAIYALQEIAYDKTANITNCYLVAKKALQKIKEDSGL